MIILKKYIYIFYNLLHGSFIYICFLLILIIKVRDGIKEGRKLTDKTNELSLVCSNAKNGKNEKLDVRAMGES